MQRCNFGHGLRVVLPEAIGSSTVDREVLRSHCRLGSLMSWSGWGLFKGLILPDCLLSSVRLRRRRSKLASQPGVSQWLIDFSRLP